MAEFNKEEFESELTAAINKLQAGGGRRKSKGGAEMTDAQKQAAISLIQSDQELKEIAMQKVLEKDQTKLAALNERFNARLRKLLIDQGFKEGDAFVKRLSKTMSDALEGINEAGPRGAESVKAFVSAIGSAIESAYHVCKVPAALAVTAVGAYTLGTQVGEAGSLSELGMQYIKWVQGLEGFDATVFTVGATLFASRVATDLLKVCNRAAQPRAAEPAAAEPPAAAAALADDPASAAAIEARRRRFSAPGIQIVRRPAGQGPADEGGRRRTKRRRHHRHRPSAPTRKRRSSSGRNRGGSR